MPRWAQRFAHQCCAHEVSDSSCCDALRYERNGRYLFLGHNCLGMPWLICICLRRVRAAQLRRRVWSDVRWLLWRLRPRLQRGAPRFEQWLRDLLHAPVRRSGRHRYVGPHLHLQRSFRRIALRYEWNVRPTVLGLNRFGMRWLISVCLRRVSEAELRRWIWSDLRRVLWRLWPRLHRGAPRRERRMRDASAG